MSRWVRVSICEQCWREHYPGQLAARLAVSDMGPCGLCRRWQGAGILVRLELDEAGRPQWGPLSQPAEGSR